MVRRVSSSLCSSVSTLFPKSVVSSSRWAISSLKAFSTLDVNLSRSSLVGSDHMCYLMSPSSMKPAMSDPSALETVDPGDARGAESLTSSGNGCGDAGC